MDYKMTQPCDNCPFRKGTCMRLKRGRVVEIGQVVLNGRGEFPCHKTVEHEDDGDGETVPVYDDKTQHCAGALIFALRQRQPSQMVRIAVRLGMLDEEKLMANQDMVFASFSAWMKHMVSPQIRILDNSVDSGKKSSTMTANDSGHLGRAARPVRKVDAPGNNVEATPRR